MPPLKSVLRQLSVPAGDIPPRAASCHSKERSFTPLNMVGPGLDRGGETVGPSPPPDLLPGTESPPVPLVQSIQKLQESDTEAATLGTSPPPGRLPKIDSPSVPPVQSMQQQLPTVPPRPTLIHGKNRNFTSPAMLQLPPRLASDAETITVGLPAPTLPVAEPPPAPPVQPVLQQFPIVPPRPAFIRGRMGNFTAPGPALETSTISTPLPLLPKPLPVPPPQDSLVQELPAAVPPIARSVTRIEKRSFTVPGLFSPSPETATGTSVSTTTQYKPFLLPSVASSRAGMPGLTVPMTVDESRRKVPTRWNNFSALLETFNRLAPVTRQPNSKL